jgi:nitroimidazol reductase NimA-like FMN-containing flavoprotein (pyridoxamine 5'-phosphate oxidase superfamily)
MSEVSSAFSSHHDARIEAAKDIFDDHPTMSIALASGGEPWIAKVFFVEDQPEPGCLDLCCSVLTTSRKFAMLKDNPTVAFVVAGELPDRWIQGTGRAQVVDDEADGAAIFKRLEDKSEAAGPFLARMPSQPVRIHVGRMKVTDVAATPPIAEFTFE